MVNNLRNRVYNLLRQSEQIFKTDMVYLAKGGLWLNLGQISVSLLSFLLSIAFANLLPQESFGTYKYILAVIGIISSISLTGLPVAITRAVAKGKEGSFKDAFFINLRWGILLSVIALLTSVYYFLHDNNVLGLGILFAGTLSPIIDSSELYVAFLNGKKDFRHASLYRFLRSFFVSTGLFITLLLTNNPVILILVYSLLHTLNTLYFYYKTVKTYRPNKEVDPETKSLAFHGSFINGLAGFSDRIDNILLFHYLGPVPLAIYNFALVIPTHLSGLIKNINILAIPKFVQGDKEVIQETLVEKTLKIALGGALISILYIISAPIIFELFFPKYITSVVYSQVYSIILIFSAALPVAFLDANMAIKEKYVASTLSSVFKIFAIFVGLYYFGLWGLIIGRLISKAFAVSMAFCFAKKI